MAQSLHDPAALRRLADGGKKFLKEVRGWGRRDALATRQPAPAVADRSFSNRKTAFAFADKINSIAVCASKPAPVDGKHPQPRRAQTAKRFTVLDPEWLEYYGKATRVAFEKEHGGLTDAEALELARTDRRLIPFLARRVREKLEEAPRVIEPDELENRREFFELLARAYIPRTHGRFSEWDRKAVRRLYDERLQLNRQLQRDYKTADRLPDISFLPVLEIKDEMAATRGSTVFMTIDEARWAKEAALIFLQAFLQVKRGTLEDLIKGKRRNKGK